MSDYEIFWVRHADSCANTLINHDPNWFDNI